MDRKLCILCYSKYSQASINLLKYINALPFDFSSVTGLTMLNIDNKQAREVCIKNNINCVPVLLVEYFFTDSNRKQMLKDDQIYQWIDEVVKRFLAHPTKPVLKTQTNITPDTTESEKPQFALDMSFDNTEQLSDTAQKTLADNSLVKTALPKPVSAAALAAEIEQQRKIEDEKITNAFKKNFA